MTPSDRDRDTPASGGSPVAAVSAPAHLDHAAAARLLRWCEAWLHRCDVGQAGPAHLVLDVGHTRDVAQSGLALLEQARVEAERRHVGIHLVGAGSLMATSPLAARSVLGRWSNFPTMDAACATLPAPRTPDPERAAPVDPDAIVLTSLVPDHLN